jgi:hypothetical protein
MLLVGHQDGHCHHLTIAPLVGWLIRSSVVGCQSFCIVRCHQVYMALRPWARPMQAKETCMNRELIWTQVFNHTFGPPLDAGHWQLWFCIGVIPPAAARELTGSSILRSTGGSLVDQFSSGVYNKSIKKTMKRNTANQGKSWKVTRYSISKWKFTANSQYIWNSHKKGLACKY